MLLCQAAETVLWLSQEGKVRMRTWRAWSEPGVGWLSSSYWPWGHSVINSTSFRHTGLPLTLSRSLKPSLRLLGQGGKGLCLFCYWNFLHKIFRAARKSSGGDVWKIDLLRNKPNSLACQPPSVQASTGAPGPAFAVLQGEQPRTRGCSWAQWVRWLESRNQDSKSAFPTSDCFPRAA